MAALKADSTTSALVLECKKALLSLTRMAKVRLTWVPGHSGVRGNAKVDRLALRVCKERPVGPEPIVGLGGAVGSAIVDRIFWQKSAIPWEEAGGGSRDVSWASFQETSQSL